jgi:hypothetical protein
MFAMDRQVNRTSCFKRSLNWLVSSEVRFAPFHSSSYPAVLCEQSVAKAVQGCRALRHPNLRDTAPKDIRTLRISDTAKGRFTSDRRPRECCHDGRRNSWDMLWGQW